MQLTRSVLCLFLLAVHVHATEETLEQRVLKLEQEVASLKQHFNTLTQASSVTSMTQKVTLVRWYFRTVQIKYNTYYAIDIELKNSFDKDIAEIDARIDFKDSLGDHFYSITITPELDIPAGQIVVDEGKEENQRLVGKTHQMRNTNNIQTELVVRRIVFTDNTILHF